VQRVQRIQEGGTKTRQRRLPASSEEADRIQRLERGMQGASTRLTRGVDDRERFFALSVDMFCVANLAGYFKRVNPAFSKALGYTEEQLLSRPFIALVHPEDRPATRAAMKQLARGTPVVNFENRYLCADGSVIWLSWCIVPFLEEGVTYAVARDISRHKRAEQVLRESEERFRTVFEENPFGMVFFAPDGRIIRANHALCRMLHSSSDELMARELLRIVYPADRKAALKQWQDVFGGKIPPQPLEQRFLREDQQPLWVSVSTSAIREPAGKPLYALSTIENIHGRKKAEEQTRLALKEKEVLLREIHHRVKNNLQIISSLLHLQAAYVKDETALEILKESQSRVRSMAIVHEQLHRGRNLSRIDFGEYLRNLALGLFRSYGVDPAVIALRLNVDKVSLNMDTAIPCGLMVHELVSNSLRHGFPDGRKGWIRISLHATPDGLVLIVKDNGAGFRESNGNGKRKSLGLRLVDILAEQLEGTVKRTQRRGTEWCITFREAPRKEVG
jgi:PAS domain S-box-containing protein